MRRIYQLYMKKIAFLPAGQGAQYPGMGRALYEQSPAARAVFDMGERLCPGVLSLCFEGDADTLAETANTQPCLFLTDLACGRAALEAGIHPAAVAGFSLGEIVALALAGVLSDEDAFRLVLCRGQAMAEAARHEPGGMVAVLKLEDAAVEALCADISGVWPVNYNAPGQLTCAGVTQSLEPFAAAVKATGGRALPLKVSGAFHTPLMTTAGEALAALLRDMDIHAPVVPLYANRTGLCYPADREGIIRLIVEQVSSGVRWKHTLEAMAADGMEAYLELGPGKTLSGLVGRTLPGAEVLHLSEPEELDALRALAADTN